MQREHEPRTHHHEPTANAGRAIGRLEEGVRLTLSSDGKYSLGDIVRAVVDQLQPCSVVVSSGFVSVIDAQSLGALLRCGALTDLLVITDRGLESKHPRSARAIEDAFGSGRVRASRCKARFAIVRGAFSVVVRGSGSLAKSRGLDLFDVDCCEQMATFMEGIVRDMVGEMPGGWAEGEPTQKGGFDASRLRF